MFRPGPDKPFLATPAAIAAYQSETILACLRILREQADHYQGIDYLQVFQATEPEKENLRFIEDGPGGAIKAAEHFSRFVTCRKKGVSYSNSKGQRLDDSCSSNQEDRK